MKRILIILMLMLLLASSASAGSGLIIRLVGDAQAFFAYAPAYTQLVHEYIDGYGVNVNELFGSMADSFSVANAIQPNFGEPHRNLAFGGTFGVSGSIPFDDGELGAKTLENVTIGLSGAVFGTFSLDGFGGFLKDSDLTAKVLILELPIPNDEHNYDVSFFNIGGVFRKKLGGPEKVSVGAFMFNGISLAGGLFYANNRLAGNVNIDTTETFKSGSSEVSLYASDADLFLQTRSLTLDLETKAYINLFWVLDIFAGGGLSFNFFNTMEANTIINGQLTVDPDTATPETLNGGLSIIGKGKGSHFVPRVMAGIQLNFGPVKIPIQGAIVFTERRSYAGNVGLTLSF